MSNLILWRFVGSTEDHAILRHILKYTREKTFINETFYLRREKVGCSEYLIYMYRRTMRIAAIILCLVLSRPMSSKSGCVLQHQTVTGYIQEGDVLLGGIFPLHLSPGTQAENFTKPPSSYSCQRFSFRSFRWILAFLFAVEEVNRRPGLLPNLTLGAAVMDSCSEANGAIGGTSWLLSGSPGGPLNYRCLDSPSRLAAVLGDAGGEAAVSVANILGLYNYPQINYFTPPAQLGNRLFFPSSLSVAPTLSSQMKGMARLLQVFAWSWVGVLFQATSSSSLGQTFLEQMQASDACLAFWENLSSEPSPEDVKQVAEVIRQSTANVVVVFSLEAYLNPVLLELAHNGDTRDRVWLTIDAWSTSPSLVTFQLSKFLRGSLGLVLRNGAAPGFREFVFGLHPSDYNNHTFFEQFWEEAFSCHWVIRMNNASSSHMFFPPSPSPPSTQSLCTGLENPATLQIFSDIGDLRVTYNVYKAVLMVARTLKDMAACTNIERTLVGSHCAEMNKFTPWQLFYYLRRVRLKGNIGDDLYFDSLGNAPAVYDIINWQEELSGGAQWVRVGSYESGAQLGHDLLINLSAIQWGGQFQQIPISFCSKECPPGFWKAPRLGQPHCCFNCILCAAGEISNQTNAVDCFLCPEEEWPNSAHNQCLPREVELLSLSDPLGMSLGSTSILGSLLPAIVLFLFIKNRETPLVRANNCTLSFILLVALTFSFLCPLLLLAPPGNQTCIFRQAAFGVLFTLCISCLLAKTIIVVLAFRSNQPGGFLKVPMGPFWPIFFAMFCTFIQFALCCSWFSVDPPFPVHDAKTQLGKIVVQCNYGLGFWFMLGYLALLSTICFVAAFLTRKLPGTFNEATHITFSMLVFLTVWISFVPAYLSTKGKMAVATEIFAILSSSASLLFCIFTPKIYIILLKPQLNTRAMVSGQKRLQTNVNQNIQPSYQRRYHGGH
ncbi:extracellular calcium-sensing receptor-like [Dendropsophus ebraccatus]|uniref:extracellular calcium-sensing receptor-like n=1 Tax=Dendropsophus ebraccatus TaxID=150705 RepID=UPI0038314651